MAANAWRRRRQTQQLLTAIRKVARNPDLTVQLTHDGIDYAVIGADRYERLTRTTLHS